MLTNPFIGQIVMMTKKITLGILIILGLLFLSMYKVTPQAKKSDHFNGRKFINPTLEKPFSPSIGDIYRMMREGRPNWPEKIENTAVPQLNETLENGDFALTFINHATFLIQTEELNILTDPVWAESASPVSWFGPKRVRKPGVAMDSLPKIDVILISHNHYDHLDKKTLKELEKRFSPLVLVPVGDKKLVESFGVKNVQEFDWWENVKINPNTIITFTPQQHSSARTLFDRDKSLWGSYYIQTHGRSIYFGGDGGYSTHFADIKERLGSPEIAMLGIGAYKPDFFMKAIHTSPAEAIKAHLDLGAIQSIGMHFGTFQLASEGFEQPLEDLKTAKEKNNLSDDGFIVLHAGETKFYRNKK